MCHYYYGFKYCHKLILKMPVKSSAPLQQYYKRNTFIAISGEFNHISLSDTLPNFHQFVNCPTIDSKTLDLTLYKC